MRLLATALSLLVVPATTPLAGVYVTETSGIRWNDVGGIRWNDVGGIRWNDVGGIRWNDVGGIRWNDVGEILFSDASGIRWNDVGGIRWNDVGGILFDDALTSGLTSIDLELLDRLSFLPDTSSIHVIVTYRAAPTAADLADLVALGIPGGTVFRRLPMVVVNATRDQIAAIAALPAVRSVYADRTLSFFDAESRALVGLDDVAADSFLSGPLGTPLSGAGVTIAVLDTGVDATHPDLPYGSKVVENVRLQGAVGTGPGFIHPVSVGGLPNTDLVLGHGTFVASVAAGTGAAGSGAPGSGAAGGADYRGVAPGASILGLSAGDLLIVNVLEGFDYILENGPRLGVRVVNCSWGTEGFFDPDDPVNVATRLLHDAGITVVFAVGNHGPSPDTLNPYAVAPWVIGAGATRKDGRLSDFSSRGIFEELVYHPTLVAPGERIVAATPILLGGPYTEASGTSFAAPHVAGAVALMLEADPALTPARIKRILQRTATPILARDRSQVGAGRLDAWAALTRVKDSARPFGTHVPGWLDRRPYRIEHRPALLGEAVLAAGLPAGGTYLLRVTPGEGALSWSLGLAWGTLPGLNDLDLTLVDTAGSEIARSASFDGTSLFGRAEGVHLLGAVPAAMTAVVTFKGGIALADQPFQHRQETSVAVVTAYGDVAALPPADRDLVARAVARHVMIGRGDRFDAADGLMRGEFARALALAAGLPQRIPPSPTFPDTGPALAEYPYVETVAGARAARLLMDPMSGSAFGPRANVTRLDFAVSMVRAAGLEEEALARSGEVLGLLDEDRIPAALRGHVAVALERGFIAAVMTAEGLEFDPKGSVPRLDAARFLPHLLDLL